jgi:AcrR family transcriptional regulator
MPDTYERTRTMPKERDGDARTLLTSAALRLFAEDGVDAVSIRAVNRAAGLNPASVHYHFSTKDALVDAVLHLYGDEVVDTIITRADAIDVDDADADTLVRVFADSYLRLLAAYGSPGADWIRLINQYLTIAPERVNSDKAQAAITTAIRRVFPGVNLTELHRVMNLSVSVLVREIAARTEPLLAGTGDDHAAALDHIDFLVAFLAGGIRASMAAQQSQR